MYQSSPNQPEQFNIGTLLANDSYRIPMYQRNYAWEEGEITQLIQDVVDYQTKTHSYYIGTLVVHKDKDVYETIDGQQRLTTLNLLVAWLRKQKLIIDLPDQLNLVFENRKNSSSTLEAIFTGTTEHLAEELINPALLNGYRIIERVMPRLVTSPPDFAAYLLKNVQIMRVEVPHDTDLNHYFEIMNSRGEQLEKHEVLKATLLSVLEDKIEDPITKMSSKACLNLVWEACANMERYAQTGFSPEQRAAFLGGKWDSFVAENFDDLSNKLNIKQISSESGVQEVNNVTHPNLRKIITSPPLAPSNTSSPKQNEAPQRFNSVINFPNFLLQVLRIYLNATNFDSSSTRVVEVPLDDKRLLDVFENNLLKEPEGLVERVKGFVYALLRCKYLYDHYIIKREFKEKDGWSLKRYKRNEDNNTSYVNTFDSDDDFSEDNRTILMLLAAFHVSAPTQAYKHWLSGALNWLYRQPPSTNINANDYLSALESLAKAYMRDRYLLNIDKKEYSKIIFKQQGQPLSPCVDDAMLESLSYGNIENNFVFNYLDYLLWKENESGQELKKGKDAKITDFEFTFRSSVEHFYPQHPLGHDRWHEGWHDNQLNTFGNLCLISHTKNSRLSNYMPKAKKEHYAQGPIDSVKQHLMIQAMGMKEEWTVDIMNDHQDKMIKVLESSLKDLSISRE